MTMSKSRILAINRITGCEHKSSDGGFDLPISKLSRRNCVNSTTLWPYLQGPVSFGPAVVKFVVHTTATSLANQQANIRPTIIPVPGILDLSSNALPGGISMSGGGGSEIKICLMTTRVQDKPASATNL